MGQHAAPMWTDRDGRPLTTDQATATFDGTTLYEVETGLAVRRSIVAEQLIPVQPVAWDREQARAFMDAWRDAIQ